MGQRSSIKTTAYKSMNTAKVTMTSVLAEKVAVSTLACSNFCSTNGTCGSYSYSPSTKTCQLGACVTRATTPAVGEKRVYSNGVACTQPCTPAVNLGFNVTVGNNPTYDPNNIDIYFTCRDVVSTSSRPVVKLASGLKVMCDTGTDGGGWTVILRRVSGTVDFYRGWNDYKRGFGDYGIGEFYLGNEFISCISINEKHEMRIDFTYNGVDYNATYGNFKLLGEATNYTLQLSNYTGNAGDILIEDADNQMFTTYDRDCDSASINCAEFYRGAWWYRSCSMGQLTGTWNSTLYGNGVNWDPTTGMDSYISWVEMKIRPLA
ncbi:fibrinogen-like protein A [Physella acuta]|uniref:fibrinogen-like protein A n=1 Tax=Physella acuta TaxID=109671 RepID=UPI0027DE80B8|nr:fibrinogen-like protein A [Physella acuta]